MQTKKKIIRKIKPTMNMWIKIMEKLQQRTYEDEEDEEHEDELQKINKNVNPCS
jgi:DNA-binding transcriptional regulator GbsR (MarR family)